MYRSMPATQASRLGRVADLDNSFVLLDGLVRRSSKKSTVGLRDIFVVCG